jgi:hypothetical protein
MFKNEQKHPFYKPLKVRIAVVLATALFFGFELWQGQSGLWIALSGGMLAFAVYTLLLTYPNDKGEDDAGPAA